MPMMRKRVIALARPAADETSRCPASETDGATSTARAAARPGPFSLPSPRMTQTCDDDVAQARVGDRGQARRRPDSEQPSRRRLPRNQLRPHPPAPRFSLTPAEAARTGRLAQTPRGSTVFRGTPLEKPTLHAVAEPTSLCGAEPRGGGSPSGRARAAGAAGDEPLLLEHRPRQRLHGLQPHPAVFGGLTLALGDWQDALFLGVLVANSTIGITQEVRAKLALDRLSALVAPRRPSSATASRAPRGREVVVGDLVRVRARRSTRGRRAASRRRAGSPRRVDPDRRVGRRCARCRRGGALRLLRRGGRAPTSSRRSGSESYAERDRRRRPRLPPSSLAARARAQPAAARPRRGHGSARHLLGFALWELDSRWTRRSRVSRGRRRASSRRVSSSSPASPTPSRRYVWPAAARSRSS